MEPSGKYLITGCGHSGTGWIAKVMNALHGPCGHEAVYNQRTASNKLPKLWSRLRGDSAWPAAAWIPAMPHDRPILHIVRNPLDVLASVHTFNFLAATCTCGHEPGVHLKTPYANYVRRHTPEIFDAETDIERAAAWIVQWNNKIEQHTANRESMMAQVEALTANPTVLVEVASYLSGKTIGTQAAVEAVAEVSPNYNSHRRGTVTWDDIPDGDIKKSLIELTDRYGYEVTP